jgi:hypothetical protein
MRRIRTSATFVEQLNTLLAQGEPKFGSRVVDEKFHRVHATIEHHIAHFPERPRDADLDLCVYPVSKTPFLVIYDFDDAELRIWSIVHARSDRTRINLDDVVW